LEFSENKKEYFNQIIAIRIDRQIGNENKYPLTALTITETISLNSDNGNRDRRIKLYDYRK
jgi:hypothetical protein